MRKIRRVLFIALVVSLLLLALAGCNNNKPQDSNGAKVYTLTFVTNSSVKIDPIIAEEGEPVPSVEPPTREGYFFQKWTLSPNGGDAVSIPTVMPAKNMTFYAIWSKDGARVTLDANGGQLGVESVVGATGRSVLDLLSDQKEAAIPVVDEGILFDGWYYNGEKIDESFTVPNEDITIVARYIAIYKVNIFKQNIENDLYTAETTEKQAPVGETVEEEYPVIEGFERVVRGDDGDKASLTLGMRSADNHIDVYYDRLMIDITYSSGGADGEDIKESKKYDADIVLKDNPFEFAHHRFAGWKLNGEIYEEGAALKVSAQMNIVATWDEEFKDKSGSESVIWLLANKSGAASLQRQGFDDKEGSVSGTTVTFAFDSPLRARLVREENAFLWDTGTAGLYPRYKGGDESGDSLRLYDFNSGLITIDNQNFNIEYYFDNAQGVYVLTKPDKTTLYVGLFEKDGRSYFYIWEDLPHTYFYTAADGGEYVLALNDGAATVFARDGYAEMSPVGNGSYAEDGEDIYRLNVQCEEQKAQTIFGSATVKLVQDGRRALVKNNDLCREITLSGGGKLVLDGFENGSYTDKNNVKKDGVYKVTADGKVALYLSDGRYDFAIANGGGTLEATAQYAVYSAADGSERLSLDGKGGAEYIDARGRARYVTYAKEGFDDDQFVIRFAENGKNVAYRLNDEQKLAISVGVEVGEYSSGNEKLLLDGKGGAVYAASGDREEGVYSKSTARPYDYTFDGENDFRFILEGKTFKKFNAAIAGEYQGKFAPSDSLYLSGYGEATLTIGGVRREFSNITVNDDIVTLGDENCKLRREEGATTGKFIMYNAADRTAIPMYDPARYDLAGNNVDRSVTLVRDGYDGFVVRGAGNGEEGIVETISDGVYTSSDGQYKFKIYDLVCENEEITVFSSYDEEYDVMLVSDGVTVALNGYGQATVTEGEEENAEQKAGYYCRWDGILVVTGNEIEGVEYFNYDLARETCTRCVDNVVDGQQLKLYIGGDVATVPGGVREIADSAFAGSGVKTVDLAYANIIGARAFYGCEALVEVTANSVTEVGREAFVGCSSLASISLNSIRTVREDAFKDLPIHVTLGASLESVGDGAFSHGEGVEMYVDWTIENTSMLNQAPPNLSGDPFEYTGDDQIGDRFVIRVRNVGVLTALYKLDGWREHAKYFGFAMTEPIGSYYDVETLKEVEFGKVAKFDDKTWAYLALSSGGYDFYFYNPMSADRIGNYSGTIDGTTLRLTDKIGNGDPYYFVSVGAELEYSHEDEMLSFTLSADNEIPATFGGNEVTLYRDSLTFDLDGYTYKLQLNADMTFSYTREYARVLMGAYACADDESSRIEVYYLDSAKTSFEVEGNTLHTTYVIGGTVVDIDLAGADSEYIGQNGMAYRFYVFTASDDLYMVDITVNEREKTYTASTREILTGATYPMGETSGSAINGPNTTITIYRNSQGTVSAVLIKTEVDGVEYSVHARVAADGTIEIKGDYPDKLLGKYTVNSDPSGTSFYLKRA